MINAERLRLMTLLTGIMIFSNLIIPAVSGASLEPHGCIFGYSNTLLTEEMVHSIKSYASQKPELWDKLSEDSYQVFTAFDWRNFQKQRSAIDEYCRCAYPHSSQQTLEAFKKRLEQNVNRYNKNHEEIENYKASYFKFFKTEPKEQQVELGSWLWSCDKEHFLPEFDVNHLEAVYPDIQDILMSLIEHIAAPLDVVIKGGTFIDRHQRVLDIGRMVNNKQVTRETELSVSIDRDSQPVNTKFDSSFLTHLGVAQKNNKEIYAYLEFFIGDKSFHRYYSSLKVVYGKDKAIAGLEAYDPMFMVKLYFPVDSSGKATNLPDFYQALANVLMHKHGTPDVGEISKVKYKVMFIRAEKKDKDSGKTEHSHPEL